MSRSDQGLDDAWERFLREMRAAGDAIFTEGLPSSPEERAEAFRYLCQGVSIGFELFVESADTNFPHLMRYFDPTHKQAGDNQDSLILDAWTATMDYRWRLSGLNSEQAMSEEDGSIRVVLAHQDPGVPDWLDASGWTDGSINYRGLLSSVAPDFRSRVTPVSELGNVLPPNARTVTSEQRQDQMRRRRAGVTKRFPI